MSPHPNLLPQVVREKGPRAAFAAAAVAVLAYLPTLTNGFVWDDLLHIAGNPRIESFRHAAVYLQRLEGVYYRPAVFFSYALDYALWGRAPAGFHLTNLLLHGLNAVLLVLVTTRMGLRPRFAFLAGAIFALHPVQADAVAYISGRTDLLMTAGALLAWRLLLGGGSAVGHGVLTALAGGGAVLSKESGYALGAFVPWFTWRRTRNWKERAALATPTVVILVILLLLRPGAFPSPVGALAGVSLTGAGRTLAEYLLLLLWPATLRIDRLTPVATSTIENALAMVLVFAALAAGAWGLTRRGPVADWTAWTVAFYLPVANLMPLYPAIAGQALFTPEHNLYAPMAGVGALIALAATRLQARVSTRQQQLLAVVVLAVMAVWGVRTAVRVRDWHDEERLYRSAVAAGATSPRVWYNLGNVLLQRRASTEAAAAFRQALQQAPHDAEVWMNLGVALQSQGLLDGALAAYQQAQALGPPSGLLLENLGTLHLARRDLLAARQVFEQALALDPGLAKSRAALEAIERLQSE